MPDTEKKYKMPPVAWLKVTDYMHGWMQWELGGALKIRGRRVISVLHLPGVRDVMRDESITERICPSPIVNSLAAVWKNCIDKGMELDEPSTVQMYKISKEVLDLFVPVECPKLCLTESGVLRPWTHNIDFSQKQSTALQKILRNEFWKAIQHFDMSYAKEMGGEEYPASDMIEAFCTRTHTPEMYVDAIRREWQRRCNRTTDANPGQ